MEQKHAEKQSFPIDRDDASGLGQAASSGDCTGLMPTPPHSKQERNSYSQLAGGIASGAGPDGPGGPGEKPGAPARTKRR